MLRANDLVGPYRLIQKLGQGQFGVVWLAERPNADPPHVALKLPLDPDIDLDALLQETTLWARASGHPNVLPIIEARIYDGQIVIASEYAPNGSLLDWLRSYNGRAPSAKAAIDVTLGILAGLAHLHQQKIIHRDLKPANVLLQGSTPRLSDFGLARVFASSIHSNVVAGTPAYMGPEAFDGVRNEQTDIWSAGVILYQLLSGTLPFPQRDAASLMGAIMRHPFAPLPASVNPSLQEIVACALQKNPAYRFRSAAEMGAALYALSRGEQQIEYRATTVVDEETRVRDASLQDRSRTINNKPPTGVRNSRQATDVVSLAGSVSRQSSRPNQAFEEDLRRNAQDGSPVAHAKKSKSGLIVGVILLVVAAILAGLIWWANRNNVASTDTNANNSNPNENRVPPPKEIPHNPALLIEQLARQSEQVRECVGNCGNAAVTGILKVRKVEINADGSPEFIIEPTSASPDN
ncbi:MAG: serine/threonine-protein kinase [Blastocatellales bacterium]